MLKYILESKKYLKTVKIVLLFELQVILMFLLHDQFSDGKNDLKYVLLIKSLIITMLVK